MDADGDDARETGRTGSWLRGVALATAIAAGWMLLVGAPAGQELAMAVTVGVATAWAGARLRRHVGHRQTGLRRWVRHLPRMVVGAWVDSARVTVTLVRALRGRAVHGRFREVPFEVGDDGPDDVGRRVLATFAATLQPNSYVVGFDRRRDVALVHELEPTTDGPIPPDLCRRRP